MPVLSANIRGIILMVAATACFVTNDSLMKFATAELPVFQVLFIRGVAAALWCLPLVFFTRTASKFSMIGNKWALLRNLFEIITVFCFINALARMPIADITAIGQLSPMILLMGAAILFREKLGLMRIGLIVVGFIGALLVAQPTMDAISPWALLGLAAAGGMAARDLAARKVPAEMPGPIVAYGAVIMVMLASGVATFLFDEWVMPSAEHIWLLVGAAFFLMFGQLFIFLTFRVAPVGVVAPFLYSSILWAMLLGFVLFGELPNAIAMAGIVLVTISGVILVMHSRKRTTLPPTT